MLLIGSARFGRRKLAFESWTALFASPGSGRECQPAGMTIVKRSNETRAALADGANITVTKTATAHARRMSIPSYDCTPVTSPCARRQGTAMRECGR